MVLPALSPAHLSNHVSSHLPLLLSVMLLLIGTFFPSFTPHLPISLFLCPQITAFPGLPGWIRSPG